MVSHQTSDIQNRIQLRALNQAAIVSGEACALRRMVQTPSKPTLAISMEILPGNGTGVKLHALLDPEAR
jgi:hypothetical protein